MAQDLGVPIQPFGKRCPAFAGMDVSNDGKVEKTCTPLTLNPKPQRFTSHGFSAPSGASGRLHHYCTYLNGLSKKAHGAGAPCISAKPVDLQKSYTSLILIELLTRTPCSARDAPIRLSRSLRNRAFYDRLPSRRGHVALPCN